MSKCLKFNLDFKNLGKNLGKVFCFSDNCIWIGIVKLSLLKRGYFSLLGNLLTSSPKSRHVKKSDFSQLNSLGSYQWIWYRWCDADLNSAWALLPCCLSKGSLKWDFLDIDLTTCSESLISERQKPKSSSFFSKRSKCQIRFKNAAKSSEKLFCFYDNCIWIGFVKLSLLRTGYFSWVGNVLARSIKIWHDNKREFFEHNLLASDQSKW